MAAKNADFTARLEKAIADTGLDNKTFAKEAKMGYSTLMNYLVPGSRGRVPEWDQLVKISKASKKTINWLLTGEEKQAKTSGHAVAESIMPYGTTPTGFMEDWNETSVEAAKKLKTILDSGDDVAIAAILSNLNAFHESVKRKEEVESQDRDIKSLKLQVRQLKKLFTGERTAGTDSADTSGTGSRKKAI